MYEGEVTAHKSTKAQLESTRSQVSALEERIAQLEAEHAEKLAQAKKDVSGGRLTLRSLSK